MDQQIEQILKRQENTEQKVSLGSLKHKPTIKTNQLDEQSYSRQQKLKKLVLQLPSTTLINEKLNNYYCSLCGRINIVTNILLDNRPRRKTDGSVSIDLKNNFLKLNLQRDKIRYLKREEGIQKQYRWKCECGIPVGYTAINYDQFEEVRKDENFKTQNKSYFYVYADALIQKMKQSKLISELITYKETILLHLKRKTHRK